MNKYNFHHRLTLAAVGDGGAGVDPSSLSATPAPADPPPADPQTLLGQAPASEPPVDPNAPPPEPPAELAAITDETFASVLPEGFVIDPEQQGAVMEAINSGGSRAEIAKNLLTLYQSEVTKFQTAQTEVWDKTQEAWQNEIKADPMFAGDKLAPSLAAAKEMAIQLGGQGLVDMLDITGAGNNVNVLKALLKARELIPQEGKPVTGTPAAQPKSLADKIFTAKT